MWYGFITSTHYNLYVGQIAVNLCHSQGLFSSWQIEDIFMPPPAKGSSGAYSVFLWCQSVCAFLHTWLYHKFISLHSSLHLSYIQVYVDIYVPISLGGHNVGTFYATKLNFGMLLTRGYLARPKPSTLCQICPWVIFWGGARRRGHLCTLDTYLVLVFFFSTICMKYQILFPLLKRGIF